MTDRKIDYETWPRKELYEHFKMTPKPFWSVVYEEDVTEVLAYAKEMHISFYYAMIHTVSRALNSVREFRYAVRADGIYELEERLPSFTVMDSGSEQFRIITAGCLGNDLPSFAAHAESLAASQKEFIRYDKETDALIFISCLPWIRVTGLTNEGLTDPCDSIPRISWGRYETKDGRTTLSMCFEVNHRLIDGYHIGQFHEAFRRIASAL
ncbi:MAG: hypothetical protein IKG46_00985 [Solobacterium sp.]|nr:hypothetical protein [Solobacterium sp.]